MTKKSFNRIHPYLKRNDLTGGIVFLSIATLFVIGILIATILLKDKIPGGWVILIPIFAVYGYITSTNLPDLMIEISAYKNQSHFLGSSLTANADIVEKKDYYDAEDDYHSYHLTISFTANTRTKGVQQQKLDVDVPHALFQNVSDGETVVVRYSIENPRIAILVGETGSDDAEQRKSI